MNNVSDVTWIGGKMKGGDVGFDLKDVRNAHIENPQIDLERKPQDAGREAPPAPVPTPLWKRSMVWLGDNLGKALLAVGLGAVATYLGIHH